MNTLKGWITTSAIALLLSPTFAVANTGIIVGNRSVDTKDVPCIRSYESIDWGIIVGNVTGIFVGNFAGILAAYSTDTPSETCGIIVGN